MLAGLGLVVPIPKYENCFTSYGSCKPGWYLSMPWGYVIFLGLKSGAIGETGEHMENLCDEQTDCGTEKCIIGKEDMFSDEGNLLGQCGKDDPGKCEQFIINKIKDRSDLVVECVAT